MKDEVGTYRYLRSRRLELCRWLELDSAEHVRMRTRTARKIYAKRSTTVEPFNDGFKGTFEMNDKVWHRGLDRNRTRLLAANFTCQLLVREANHGRRKSRRNGRIRELLDAH